MSFEFIIMGLFDFFRKKKPASVKPAAGKKIKEEKKKPLKKKEEVRKGELKPVAGKPRKKISEKACRILYTPHVTEKATALTEENKYVFKVSPKANKIEIKKAVEDLYGVNVINVRIINIPRRQRRLGKQKGWRKGYKKAIVKIKKGQKIEILPR